MPKFVLLCLLCIFGCGQAAIASAERWSTERANEWYDAIAWPVGANFVPSTAINQLEMWQADTFDPETIDRELGWASDIGMNTMRVFLHDVAWRTDRDGFFARVDEYLEIADGHGIRTMFVVFDGVWDPTPLPGVQPAPRARVHNSGWVQSPGAEILGDPSRHDELRAYVQDVLRRYKDDRRVLVWDLFNEPDNDQGNRFDSALSPEAKRRHSAALLDKTFDWAREIDPAQPLTAGVWGSDRWFDGSNPAAQISLERSDVISFHVYEPPNAFASRLERLMELGRPILCTEYMARSAGSTFQNTLPLFFEHRIGAYNWGLVDGKSQTIYPWDSWTWTYTSEPEVWFHDVFQKDGTPYDASETELIGELTSLASAGKRPEPARPNVIFVLIDDMGYADLSCFGGTLTQTPHIDRLAREGMRLERFYVNSPICSPSRAAFMTGQYPQRWGIHSFLNTGESNAKRGMPNWLDPAAPSIARAFDDAGYRTAHVGKWHLGGQREIDDAPLITDYGFDSSLTNFEGLGERVLPVFEREKNGPWRHWPTRTNAEVDVENIEWVDRWRVTERFVDEALSVLEGASASGDPLYMQLWLDDVHTPIEAPPGMGGDGSGRARFAGMLREMDRQLGRVFDAVRADANLRDNTLIILTSDNGHEEGFGSGGPLRGSKTTLYEGGIRMPMIAWWPGVVPAGHVDRDSLVAAIDLPPTLVELAGLPETSDTLNFEGMESAEVFRGDSRRRGNPIFFARPVDRGGRNNELPDLAIVDLPWKLLVEYDGSNPELYRLDEDPGETRDLSGEGGWRVGAMSREVLSWWQRVNADAPREPAPTGELLSALASHDRAVHVKGGWIRDPYIVLGDDGWYYLSGTTPLPTDPRGHVDPYNTGLGQAAHVGWKMQAWRSRDLASWESLGTPFSLKDGIWWETEPGSFDNVPEPQWRLWAPEFYQINGSWVIVHTSPSPVQGANLSVTRGAEFKGPFENPMGRSIGRRHDPSLFEASDGSWWMAWGATEVAPLKEDLSGFAAEPVRITFEDGAERIGHEGCVLLRIGEKYVLFGTGWSTRDMRKGSYNLYYATSDNVTGPYSERRFVGRFLGHGTPFQDKDGRWWCTAFFNGDHPPVSADGVEARDLSSSAYTINEQGVTLVPLEVTVGPDGEPVIRAKDPRYRNPGPDELEQFSKK